MLTAVFLVGKLDEIGEDYRYVLVEKVPQKEVLSSHPEESFDKIKCVMWSGNPSLLHRLVKGTIVSLKGRLEERKGELVVVVELFRTT